METGVMKIAPLSRAGFVTSKGAKLSVEIYKSFK